MALTAEEEQALAALEPARVGLIEALDELGAVVAAYRQARNDGASAVETYRKVYMRDMRDRLHERLAVFDRAFTASRAAWVKVLVDHEGMTFTDVARLANRSRQFITRLYQQSPKDA